MEKEFIQLPPLPKDLETKALMLIWEYLKFPKDRQEVLREEMDKMSDEKFEELPEDIEKKIKEIPEEDFADYQETVRKVISKIVNESCGLCVWVYEKKYTEKLSLNEIIAEYPNAEMMITAMYYLMDRYRKPENDGWIL